MKKREALLIGVLLIFGLNQTGCASFNAKLKHMLGGDAAQPSTMQASHVTRFSDTPDLPPRVRRQYHRVTEKSLEAASALDASAGSLWSPAGQGAFLFSQNVVRLIGDPLAVKLDGDPRDQLQSKVNVIAKLLERIEQRRREARLRSLASQQSATSNDNGKVNSANKTASNQKKQDEPALPGAKLKIQEVPTRIVERTVEGNYRVKGSEPFMIGSHQFKVIVMGIVRAEDFNDDGISATKLLDPKFDIVSARAKETAL